MRLNFNKQTHAETGFATLVDYIYISVLYVVLLIRSVLIPGRSAFQNKVTHCLRTVFTILIILPIFTSLISRSMPCSESVFHSMYPFCFLSSILCFLPVDPTISSRYGFQTDFTSPFYSFIYSSPLFVPQIANYFRFQLKSLATYFFASFPST